MKLSYSEVTTEVHFRKMKATTKSPILHKVPLGLISHVVPSGEVASFHSPAPHHELKGGKSRLNFVACFPV